MIPELKLALEFNGNYYHSIEAGTPFGYHLMKTELCEAKGYRLIHIWEDEWNNDKELIKEKLIQVFQNKEIIDNKKLLDRSWYSALDYPKYTSLPPILINRNGFQVENCRLFKKYFLIIKI